MTNSAALVKNSIWRKPEFRALPRLAQCTYMQVLGLKDIDRAGLFQLNIRQLMRGCDELTIEALRDDIAVLEVKRWLFVDEETDEAFIRHHMRTFEVWKYPQYLANAFKGARMVESVKIRRELAAELRLLRRLDATAVADEIDPLGTVPPGSKNSDSTVPDGVSTVNGASTVQAPTSVSTSVSKDLLVSGYLGEDDPSQDRCAKHKDTPDPPNCWACKRRREAADSTADAKVTAQARAAAERRRIQLECVVCDGTNWIPHTEPAVRCTHEIPPSVLSAPGMGA